MRSGKPPAPWRRDRRRRGPSIAAIAALIVVFTAAGTYLLWRARPEPLPWHPVGAERIVTPAFDIADAEARKVMQRFARADTSGLQGQPLIEGCSADAANPGEVYLLSRTYLTSHTVANTRTRVVLGVDGEAIVAKVTPSGQRSEERRRLNAEEAEVFRSMLLEAGYPQMPPYDSDYPAPPRKGDATLVSLQSCVRGRYYGVLRQENQGPDSLALQDLAAKIEAFALGGSKSSTPD